MQCRFYRIGLEDRSMEEELNAFLRSVRVLQMQKEFVDLGANSFWTLCVEYIESVSVKAKNAPRSKVDYKEVLSPKDFELFSKLRELRKEMATEEAVPVYAVCTNEQLAEIAKQHPQSLVDLKKVDGLGEAKVKKYGERMIRLLNVGQASSLSAENQDS